MRRLAIWISGGIFVMFVLIQFIPVAGAKTNPPVLAEPLWDSHQTRELAVRACYDCHSNETHWPWYSNVAPVSWLVVTDTLEGRNALNFSEWNRPQEEASEAAETVLEGSMPLKPYLLTHPEAHLGKQEKDLLVQGLMKTLGGGLEHNELEKDND